MNIREFLQRRIDAGESKSDIGRRLGVHQSYITRWLTGMVPDPKACRLIAEGYGLPVNAVLEMAGHVEPTTQGDDPVDPEWEVMQRELREVFESFERSRWSDLRDFVKAGASLLRPELHSSPDPSPQSSRRGGNHAVPVLPASNIVWEAVAVVPTSRVRTQLSGPQRQLAGVA